ncbi:MAG TPA: hypothetical protein VM557_09585 [Thermoanaerobaculia bacterium]|nr:hypothetical protein [Thermoanaerobaculia bacterium]
MESQLRQRLEAFLRPLYQDLDGVSRFEDVDRIEALARGVAGNGELGVHLELLVLFHRLGGWLARMGNASRVVLAAGGVLQKDVVAQTSDSLAHLDAPRNEAERVIAAALLIDSAGVRGVVSRLAHARRDGQSMSGAAAEFLSEKIEAPEWMNERARELLRLRTEAARSFAQQVIDEENLADLKIAIRR